MTSASASRGCMPRARPVDPDGHKDDISKRIVIDLCLAAGRGRNRHQIKF